MASKGKSKEALQMLCVRCGEVNDDPDKLLTCCKSSVSVALINLSNYWISIRYDDNYSGKKVDLRNSCDALAERLRSIVNLQKVTSASSKGKKKRQGKSEPAGLPRKATSNPTADDIAVANGIIIAAQCHHETISERKLANLRGEKMASVEEASYQDVPLTKEICEMALQIADMDVVKDCVDRARADRAPADTLFTSGGTVASDPEIQNLTDSLAETALGSVQRLSNVATTSKTSKKGKGSGEAKGLVARVCLQGESHRDRMPIYEMPEAVPLEAEGRIAFGNPIPAQDPLNIAAVRAERATLRQRIDLGSTHSGDMSVEQLHELREHVVTPDQGYQVLTNHFRIEIPEGTKLYEYHVSNIPDSASRSKKSVFIRDMMEVNQTLWDARADIASDYKKKIISRKPLFDDRAIPDTLVQNITINDFKAGTANNMPVQLRLGLVFIAVHDLDGMTAFVAGKDEGYKAALATEALNIVIGKAVTDSADNSNIFQVGTNRFYHRPGWQALESRSADTQGLVAVRGYYASVKPAMGAVLLNINAVNSVFYKAQNLADFFGTYNTGKDMNQEVFDGFQRFLSGLRVWLNLQREGPDGQTFEIDEPARRTKTLCELGDLPMKQTFEKDGKPTVVWDHVSSKYPDAIETIDKKLPTGNVGRKDGARGKYYLAHQLDVLADQLYRRQLSPELTRSMISVARIDPSESCYGIVREGLAALVPAFEGSLDVQLDQNMMNVAARRIPRPEIVYNNGESANADKGWWDIDDRQFVGRTRRFDPNQGTAAVHFFRSTDMFYQRNRYADHYVRCFLAANKKYGVQPMTCETTVASQMTRLGGSTVPNVRRELAKLKPDTLAVLVFDKNAQAQRNLYASFKIVADQFLGIKSICICEDRVLGSCGAKKNAFDPGLLPERSVDYFRNLAMKVNLRAGNFNHVVKAQDLPRIGSGKCNTIILGADVTHPSPGSVEGTPSIAAVVGSVPSAEHDFAHFSGSMRLNTSRIDIIAEMEQMATERLREWTTSQGHLPDQILFYRDGVSSSQYPQVRETEITAIRRAWDQLSNELQIAVADSALPMITTVVVTKRHHTRFYPKPGSNKHVSKSKNCGVGTVVDSAITSPYYFDFYLLSHHVPAGTAKPAHYFVLENGIGFTEKELQDLTFNLCFMYCKSACSVSYAPPAYYADRLCERGRLYLQPFFDEVKDKKFEQSSAKEVFTRASELFYRGGGRTNGLPANPWHVNHDGIMFWM